MRMVPEEDRISDIIVETDVRARMRDRISLSCDVYRPGGKAAKSEYPVVLLRTPYGKDAPDATYLDRKKLVRSGYLGGAGEILKLDQEPLGISH